MTARMTRNQIMAALADAGVAFDNEATLVQLRALYERAQRGSLPQQQRPDALQQADAPQQPDEPQQPAVPQQRPQIFQQPDVQQQGDAIQAPTTMRCQLLEQPPPVGSERSSPSTVRQRLSEAEEEEELLNRQLAIARKRRELQILQQELGVNEKRLDLAILDAMVVKFDGSELQDVRKWTGDLENVFEAYNYAERDKLVAARHLMTGQAKRFASIITVRSYGELKAALLQEFERAFSRQDVFAQLKARTMKSNETPRQYIIEMQLIASRSNIPELELIDIIIDGLQDKSSQVSMLYSATTLAELKVLMERYEKKKRIRTQFANTATGGKQKEGAAAGSTQGGAIKQENVRCFNCFAYGHFQSACTAPRRHPNACFVCNEVGHTRFDCPKKKTRGVAAAVTAVEATDENLEDRLVRRVVEQLTAKNWSG
ncbi:uncharacterized protein LOC118749262 [Rhagoletis pomonella]|uniref:uncharacterized protein LOC118749262 n=1 Tax=Rhagoletis pomonella TaxID=28610 RepID=UPI00177D74F0|nr:uncharacterized protein LOC118749262 [Rhagoletis pomonella]